MNARAAYRTVAVILASGTLAAVLAFGLGWSVASSATSSDYAQLTGSSFVAAPSAPFSGPTVRELVLPQIEDGTSIWGATGRDSRGHIWVGIPPNLPE